MSHSTMRINALELKTPPALANLQKRFEPVTIQPDETPVPPSSASYFERMAITRNIEHDSGSTATYDVQPDTRFIANYIQHHIAQEFPEMNIKGHPMVSPLSLAGYCMHMFYAHLFGCDAYFRPQKSYWAKTFLTDQGKKDLFDTLLNCYVPAFLADILTEISPAYDPRRTNHLFVPTLAGYSHEHDFGRTLPPYIWYKSHHLLATTSTRKEPDDYQDDVYEIEIMSYREQPFHIANYMGTRFGIQHTNWVNQDFESFFNPIVGRALTQKPTFGKLPLYSPEIARFTEFDPYTFFLCADDNNIVTTSNTLGALSTFFKSLSPSSIQLGRILASLSGALIFSHSIEPPTLPTWTGHALSKNTGTDENDVTFAKRHNFMTTKSKPNKTISWLKETEGLKFKRYGITKGKFDPKMDPVPIIPFDPSTHVAPYVLYFQPYDVNSSSLALTIVAGLKIELAEIDGFTVPVEHPECSLDDNNSQYLQAAVPINQIRALFIEPSPLTNHTRITARRALDRTRQAIAIAFRSMAFNSFPQLMTEDVDDTHSNQMPGMHPEDNHSQSDYGFTFTAGTSSLSAFPTSRKIYGWSSYRVVTKYQTPDTTDVRMILSFRPIYGENVTLSRSKNPSLIIPH